MNEAASEARKATSAGRRRRHAQRPEFAGRRRGTLRERVVRDVAHQARRGSARGAISSTTVLAPSSLMSVTRTAASLAASSRATARPIPTGPGEIAARPPTSYVAIFQVSSSFADRSAAAGSPTTIRPPRAGVSSPWCSQLGGQLLAEPAQEGVVALVVRPLPDPGARDQAGALEDRHVLRRRGLGDACPRLNVLKADAQLPRRASPAAGSCPGRAASARWPAARGWTAHGRSPGDPPAESAAGGSGPASGRCLVGCSVVTAS